MKGNVAMVTDTAQHGTTADQRPGVIARMFDQVRQGICGLHGHDALLHFEHGRLSLMCTSCGYESPGWDVKGQPAGREASEPAPRMRLPLVQQRRVA